MAEKLGMTQIFVDDRAVPVTVLRAGPCHVSQVKTLENDGYAAVQLSFGDMKPSHVSNPQAGHFSKAGVAAARHLTEVRVADTTEIEAGQELTVGQIFEAGMTVDVTGVTKGKGFSGVMKRHNFKGQLASHGVHRVHRKGGSIGAAATPSRVFKGMPMAGRLGNDRQTILNLEVVEVDLDENLIMLRGSVPGAKGAVVVLRHAVKMPEQDMPEPPVVEEEPVEEDTSTSTSTSTEDAEVADEAPTAEAAEEPSAETSADAEEVDVEVDVEVSEEEASDGN